MRIAIKFPNWVGDVVMATSALKSVRRSFPDAEIYVVLRPGHRDLLKGSPLCDGLVGVDERGARVFLEGLRLRRLHFDTALILPRSFRAAFLMRLSRARHRIGFAISARSLLLTKLVEYRPRTNTRDMYLRLCEAMGCKTICRDIELPVNDAQEKRAEEICEGAARPLVGLVPGGSYGSAKLWPVEHFARAAEIIREKSGAGFVVLHGPGEDEVARAVADAIGGCPRVSEGLGVLKSVVRRLDLLLTNDTGPRHVGVAFGIPTVVLMGPTRDEYTDYEAENLKTLREPIECGPCQKRVCPRDNECMKNLLPERVAEECLEMIQSSRRES